MTDENKVSAAQRDRKAKALGEEFMLPERIDRLERAIAELDRMLWRLLIGLALGLTVGVIVARRAVR